MLDYTIIVEPRGDRKKGQVYIFAHCAWVKFMEFRLETEGVVWPL